MADKRIKDLTILTTDENNDELVIDDISVADSEKTKKITKANFLKEIVANFANYYSKTESDNRYLQSFTEEDPIFSAWLLDKKFELQNYVEEIANVDRQSIVDAALSLKKLCTFTVTGQE